MMSMHLTLRQATIIAIMTCLCHALPLESAVVKKVGSRPYRMALIRIVAAFLAGVLLNLLLPELPQPYMSAPAEAATPTLQGVLTAWLWSSAKMSVMIWALIFVLMFIQRAMEAFGVMHWLTRPLRPLMRLFGLPENASYLWLVGNVVGISYGSAMMLDLEESGQITKEEANEVNYHLIMNHSMLEDTMVFAATGVSAWWILPRASASPWCWCGARK